MLHPLVQNRGRGRKLTTRHLVLPLLAGLLAIPATPATADDAAPSDPRLAAQAQAVASGQSVPIDDLTTEISTTAANPDGTFTSTTSVMPVRVRKNGAWTPVDATLAANPDGTLSPQATPNGVTLSAGGTGPLVTLTHEDGHSIALTLPFALPTPTSNGDTALYKEVLPGVDLSVSVTDQGGFSDILIVHDAAAAANPKVKQLTFAASAQGLSLSATPSGGMNATTTDGALDYTGPQPLMWDSSTPPTAMAKLTADAESTAVDAPTAPTVSSADGPGVGALVDQVPMSTTSTTFTLTPDATVLADPATTYPVYIDPYMNPVTASSGAYDEVYSSSTCNNSPQYNKPQPNGEGVGYQRWGGACGNGKERSFYAIPSSGLDPSMEVSKAIISISSTYAASWDCSQNQPITLHTTGGISSTTDWLSQPGDSAGYATVSTTIPSGANSNSSCSNHTANFTVTAQAQKIADTNSASGDFWTVGLFGDESSTSDNYLRMSSVLTLNVTYDIPPAAPSSPHTVPAAAKASGPCVMSGDGWIGATTYSNAGSNIQLHSIVTTAISGEKAAAHYDVWDRSVLDASGYGIHKSTPDSAYLASGTDASMPIGFKLLDGHEYGWDVYSQTDSAQHLKSPMSDHCWFKTDFSGPETPTVNTNPSFPSVGSGPADPLVYAGPGQHTDFTVSAADGPPSDTSCTPNACLASGIDHFLWQLDTQPTAATGIAAAVTSTNTAGTATAKFTIPVTNWGVHTLYVVAVDRAGNASSEPAGYTYTAPWDPATKITPGDISGDGIPDLLATTSTGDLDLITGDTDLAQSAAPTQTGPLTGTPPPITGPVTVSTAAQSPDGTGWNNYLVAHRGNLHGADVDDLFAYNKQTKQLYVYQNDLDPADDNAFPRVKWSTYPGFISKRSEIVVKDGCESAAITPDDSRCRTADYDTSGWDITQLITPGNVFNNTQNNPAVITVENKRLWIYQTTQGKHLHNPILLGDGDWSGYTLIAPGTVGGTLTTDTATGSITGGSPVLWARDDISGTVLTFPIAVEPNTKTPTLLHAPVRTALTSAVAASGGGKLCLDVYNGGTADGTKVQTWGCNQTRAQTWSMMSDGTIRALGGCLDVYSADTANGTPVQLHSCNGTPAQEWVLNTSGSLKNPNSGKCLDDPNASTTAGTQLQIYTCNGTAAQNWTTGAAPGWQSNLATPLAPVLSSTKYPAVMSPGDLNSTAGGPDGRPELYAVDSAGQLMEYPGATPQGQVAAFSAPASLGAVGNTATHGWRLNDGTGATASDDPGNLNANLAGAYAWTNDTTRGKVLQLSGTTGYAATSGPAVNTAGSFTVSAWVKLGSLTSNSTFASQSGSVGNVSGFQLYYSSGAKAWAFGRHTDGTATSSFSAAYGSGTPVVAGRWTHLVGVFDATANQMLLYVDGRLAGAHAYTGVDWNADNAVQIGRKVAGTVYAEYANGSVSDIRIYPTALPAANAAATGELPRITQLD
jgi:hypothetical protein